MMGNLTPGVTYIYERVDNKIYAREHGKSDRKLVGYSTSQVGSQYDRNFTLWNDILLEAEQNPALQQALEKVIMLYRLSKDNPL
jgi:hypothetical protein